MASITASDQDYLDRAQGYFPKQAEVAMREQAVAAARVRKKADDDELKRLNHLAGPMAIARVLERWRADHAEAEASARERHQKKSAAALLRGSRGAQKARAMLLLPALLDRLEREGVAPELIAGLDLGDIGQKAAERFDRGVNARRAARRLFGPRGPAEGPG